jgi:iron-sulfur cluster repair protein YtfE (RIC family)
MARRTPTEIDTILTFHDQALTRVEGKADANTTLLEAVRREHEGEIKLLKDQVSTLKAESKARDNQDAEIKVLKKEIETPKEDNKSWKVWFNTLSAAVVGALVLAALGLRK